MYTVLYHVEFYDEINAVLSEECGLVYADNFTEAMRHIEDYYGKDLEAVKSIELYDSCVFTFSPEMLPTIKKEIEESLG